MPTYQYRCTQCGHELEAVQKFTDPALTVCPECSGVLRKVFNAVGVVFKGSGFYRTDSRAADAKKASSGSSKGSSASENGSKSTDTSSSGDSAGSSSDTSSNGSSTGSSGSGSADKGGSKPTPAASSSPSSS